MDKKLILNTKLYIPPIRQNQIARKALNKKLDQGYKTGHKVILVSAAAGYGKTTLISGWVNRLDCTVHGFPWTRGIMNQQGSSIILLPPSGEATSCSENP